MLKSDWILGKQLSFPSFEDGKLNEIQLMNLMY